MAILTLNIKFNIIYQAIGHFIRFATDSTGDINGKPSALSAEIRKTTLLERSLPSLYMDIVDPPLLSSSHPPTFQNKRPTPPSPPQTTTTTTTTKTTKKLVVV